MRRWVALIMVLIVCGCSARAVSAQSKAKAASSLTLLANLADKRVTESSGLAASRKTPGLLWTHNDGGDGPYLYATDAKGRQIGRFRVVGAKNVDWEDIAIAAGPDGKPWIYIGDFGDNAANRRDCCVYAVPEPDVDLSKTGQEGATMFAVRYPFRYPDGCHDAETLLVHPTTGEMLVVTKLDSGQSGVYAFPTPHERDTAVLLRRVGTVTFTNPLMFGKRAVGKLATGGAVSPDGRHVAIRTYTEAFEWSVGAGQTLAQALEGEPRRIAAPWLGQFESITYTPDGRYMLTTSEGTPCPLWQVVR